ncbi:hypothetical protein LTR17_007917 [Elasticomyces elasticus]|nr:hypothetical protein LTR17_007917 [Elasticomyces elasticus]
MDDRATQCVIRAITIPINFGNGNTVCFNGGNIDNYGDMRAELEKGGENRGGDTNFDPASRKERDDGGRKVRATGNGNPDGTHATTDDTKTCPEVSPARAHA